CPARWHRRAGYADRVVCRRQRLGSRHREAGPELPAQRVRSLIAMPEITFKLNGNPVTGNADNDEEMLWVLRDRLEVHGLKYGCGMGLCGACTSHIDGVAHRLCITRVGSVSGKNITTIEGLAKGGWLQPVQQAGIAYDEEQ